MIRSRFAAIAAAITLVFSLAGVEDAAAVATATGTGIRITDPNGGPLAQAKITLTFNGAAKTAETDDDGVIAIVWGGSGAAVKPGTVVLDGDGTGTVVYPGGPAGGETFTAKDGVITFVPSAVESSGGGLSKTAKIGIAGGAGAILVGVLASGGSDSSTGALPPSAPGTPQTPATPPSGPPSPPTSGAPPAGLFGVQLVCIDNPRGHHEQVRADQVTQVEVTGTAGTITFGGPSPWVGVTGTWEPTTGRFTATGRGRVAGNASIRCNFDGTLTPSGELEGDFVMGVGGGLPGGGTVTYHVRGRRN